MSRRLNHDKRPLDTTIVSQSKQFEEVMDILCGVASLISPEAVAHELLLYFEEDR